MKKNIALKKFIWGQNLEENKKIIRQYPWDPIEWEEKVILTANNIVNLLLRYIKWEISYEYLIDWADFLEVREDIDFEEDNEDIISELIHILANPLLEWKLKNNQIRDYIKFLKW